MNIEDNVLTADSQSSPPSAIAQPHNSGDDTYGFDTGGIVSYVVPPRDSELKVVDAVQVVPEHQIIEKRTKKKRLFFFGGIFLILIIVLAVIAVVVLTLTRKGKETGFVPDMDRNPTTNTPSKAPSASPTNAVTIASKALNDFLFALERHYDGTENVDAIFSNASSPQYRAAAWTVESVSANDDEDRMIRRFALATFYFATNGDDWVKCGRESKQCELSREWLTGENECNWYAIECDDDGDIIEIFFPPNGESSNNIRGTLPHELSFLSKLAVFIISRGPISGPFPDWSKLSTLEQLLLSENDFEGSFPAYLLPRNPLLGTIRFNNNNFQGTFLQDLLSVGPIGVTDISVNENNFTGPIPSQINKLSSLRNLDIGSNGFTGTLPEEIFALTNLLSFNLSDTRVSGELSENIGDISKLIDFYVGSTNMSGTLPSQLFSLNQLRKLDLGFASFTGSLSESFLMLTNLDFAKLDHNGFKGTIPPGFENLPFLENLELHDNDLSGSVPKELCDRRGDGFMELQVLTVDCLGDDPEVLCTCCSNCP